MTDASTRFLAYACCALLIVWELLKGRWRGALLAGLVMTSLVAVPADVGDMLAVVLALPVVFEERWSRRAEKDMIRGCLAAAVIAASAALLVVW